MSAGNCQVPEAGWCQTVGMVAKTNYRLFPEFKEERLKIGTTLVLMVHIYNAGFSCISRLWRRKKGKMERARRRRRKENLRDGGGGTYL